MLIDVMFAFLMLAAIFKGLRRGLIVAIFSLLACIAGLAAAIKMSVVVANYLKGTVDISARWLPIIAFILVFVAVALLVRSMAKMLEAAIDFAMMEWLNKMGGVFLYILLYIAIFSVLLFYGTSARLIPDEAIASSKLYRYIEPWGPDVVNQIGRVVPFFKDMFSQLEDFFSNIAQKVPG